MLPKNKIIITILTVIFLASAGFFILNSDVSIRQGVNGHYRQIHMPLYVKGVEFLARHYEYARLTKEIIAGCRTDRERVLKIFDWTHENIKKVPSGMAMVDDHVLNIIIRGYGTCDQSQDVFTTLCSYAGIPAFWDKVYNNAHTVWYPVAFVKLDGKWRVFDSYYGKYFLTKTGDIASVEDIIKDNSIVKSGLAKNIVLYRDIPYAEFYSNLKPVGEKKTLRPKKQMPFSRTLFEIKKLFGIEKEKQEGYR